MKKPLVVMKFGGGALGASGSAIPIAIERIKAVHRSSEVGPVVVFSAPKMEYEGKNQSLTDVALKIGESYANFNPIPPDPIFEFYRGIGGKYIDTKWRKEFEETLYNYAQKIKNALSQTMENRLFVDVNRARVLAYTGELLTASFMDYALRTAGLNSTHLDFARWPVITDKNFESANFLLTESRDRAQVLVDLLDDGYVPSIGGYIGSTENGLETTFERGGSDRTAADLAVLLSETYRVTIDLEKEDVVRSAHPGIVHEGLEPVWKLSYNEADLAGKFGMSIVDPIAIRDVMEADMEIPIHVTCMSKPDKVTVIERAPFKTDGNHVKIVTGRKECAIVELDKGKRTSIEDHFRSVRRYQEFMELRPYQQGKKEYARFLFLDSKFVKRFEDEIKAFDKDASIDYGLAAITLVGDDMGKRRSVAAEVFEALGHANVNIEDGDLQQPTSSILIIVRNEGLSQAIRAIHKKTRVIEEAAK